METVKKFEAWEMQSRRRGIKASSGNLPSEYVGEFNSITYIHIIPHLKNLWKRFEGVRTINSLQIWKWSWQNEMSWNKDSDWKGGLRYRCCWRCWLRKCSSLAMSMMVTVKEPEETWFWRCLFSIFPLNSSCPGRLESSLTNCTRIAISLSGYRLGRAEKKKVLSRTTSKILS